MKNTFRLLLILISCLVLNIAHAAEDKPALEKPFSYDDYQTCQSLISTCPDGEIQNLSVDMCVWNTLKSNQVCDQSFSLIKQQGIDFDFGTFGISKLGFNFYHITWSSVSEQGMMASVLLTPNMKTIDLTSDSRVAPNWVEIGKKLKLPDNKLSLDYSFGGVEIDEKLYFDKARSAVTYRIVSTIFFDYDRHNEVGYLVRLLKFSPNNELQKTDFQYLDVNNKIIN